jgi:SAM-dependent methyltransferase
MTEIAKVRHLCAHYCTGNGIDIGTGGDPIVPHAIQVELSLPTYLYYNSNQPPRSPIQWHGDDAALNLPFKDSVLDWVASSHLIEDYLDWTPCLREWTRVLRPGGRLIINLPDKVRWQAALDRGQPPNCAHKHESHPGELSSYAPMFNWRVIEDRLTNVTPEDYNILFVAEKLG